MVVSTNVTNLEKAKYGTFLSPLPKQLVVAGSDDCKIGRNSAKENESAILR